MQPVFVTKRDGSKQAYDVKKIQKLSAFAVQGLDVSQSELEANMHLKFFDGIKTSDILDAQIISAGELISMSCPQATFAAARLLLVKVYSEIYDKRLLPDDKNIETIYAHRTLKDYFDATIGYGLLDPRLMNFDFEALQAAIEPENDLRFELLGLQTIADRYLLRKPSEKVGEDGELVELPQHMFMRIAMGLALRDVYEKGLSPSDPKVTADAIEFYRTISRMDAMNSTPTLFNSGLRRPQMSSCFVNQVQDSLTDDEDDDARPQYGSIYGTIEECAKLSKWAGGIGTDWTLVRGAGELIRSTNGKSSGVIPFLKVYNDTAVAANQSGKRAGSFAPYLEPWHPDFIAFCELKKNTGDDRMRAHDIFPAAWINELLFERVDADGVWSFFSPAEHPELHSLWGDAFKERYEQLEKEGKFISQMPAKDVWKKMLTMLWETGHPWLCNKDESNRRNPQQHVGQVNSSNLCTEILLNTDVGETAVCNLCSTNLAAHLVRHEDGTYSFDFEKLRRTVRTVAKMLDNVIDLNFYPSKRAKNANKRHRPVGGGVMGLSEVLAALGIEWGTQENLEFQDELFEKWSFFHIEASADLARERGSYSSFHGSLWSQGILPIDTAKPLAFELTKRGPEMPWKELSEKVKGGMRNSLCMAIAPTATISNVTGTTPCIEPPFELEYVKSNLSGTFKVISPALRYGKTKEATAIDPDHIMDAGAVRSKWIDQSQSLNLFVVAGMTGGKLARTYRRGIAYGVKTNYYLRRKIVSMEEVAAKIAADKAAKEVEAEPEVVFCSIDNPECEACQ